MRRHHHNNTRDRSGNHVPGLELNQLLASLHEIRHGVVHAELQEQIGIQAILKVTLKTNDVGVVQSPVNANLTPQLLLGARFDQSGLGNDLQGILVPRLHGSTDVTLGKSPLYK
jgi:hypothetical protein